MLEDQEELLETWFFKRFAKGLDLDLEVYFCNEKLRGMLLFGIFYYWWSSIDCSMV